MITVYPLHSDPKARWFQADQPMGGTVRVVVYQKVNAKVDPSPFEGDLENCSRKPFLIAATNRWISRLLLALHGPYSLTSLWWRGINCYSNLSARGCYRRCLIQSSVRPAGRTRLPLAPKLVNYPTHLNGGRSLVGCCMHAAGALTDESVF